MRTILKIALILVLLFGLSAGLVASCSVISTDNTEQPIVTSCDLFQSLIENEWQRCCKEHGIGCEL